MKNKILIIFFLFVSLNKCSVNYRFDKYYKQKNYKAAYQVLRNNGNPNKLSYKERELKSILHLIITGQNQYLSVLDSILLKPAPKTMYSWYDFSKAWLRYISATSTQDYLNILLILPKTSFKERKIEHLRLIIQSHSLLQLKRYQEIISNLYNSSYTKNNSDILYIQGLAYFSLKDYNQAIKSFRRILRVSTNDQLKSLTYYYIATILENKGDLNEAETYYFNAWNLYPNNAKLNYNIGTLLQKKKYDDLHYRFYRASLRLNEDLAEAWYRLNIQ